MPKVVVAMPAYRAAGTLQKTVDALPQGLVDELIVVDDASPDATVEVASELGLRVVVHDRNRGYGGNQKTCYQNAIDSGADVVVLLHPDFQYDPRAIPLLVGPIIAGDADMTFGSRFAGLSDPLAGGMPLYRFVGNRLTTAAQNLMLGARFTEMHSGMRAYSRRCLLSLPFLDYSDDFVFDTQLLVDAIARGQRVVEVPIPTRYTTESSSISIPSSLRYVRRGLGYTAAQAVRSGRRASRSRVAPRQWQRGRRLGEGPPVDRECALCGHSRHQLVYPANVSSADVPVAEFTCTTGALGQHDDIIQCQACSFVSAVPTLAADEIVERYRDVVDPDYLAEEDGRRELFRWLLGRMGAYYTDGRRVVEMGSHVGIFLHEATRAGWKASGFEPSRWAVEQGRERFGVDLHEGTIETLDAIRASADAIVMLDVLEHLNDPLAALRHIRPVLRDDGILVLSTVNLDSPHARLRGGDWPWFIRSHLHYFSPQTLQHMLARAGFRMVEWRIVPRNFKLSYVAERGAATLGGVASVAQAVSKVVDPALPVGWLGDIAAVIARPVRYGER